MANYQSSIKRYQVYKDSAIVWLENIPEHWEEKRVKDIALLERGKFTHRPRNDPQMYDGVHPFIQTGDVARANKYITTYKQTLSDRGTTVSKWFPKGTLVMTIAANIGDVAIVDFETYFPDSIVAYKPKKNDKDYLFYLFFATKYELDKVKVTSTQDNLNLERLNSLIKFIPPLFEQKTIAHYLDTKTAQIDHKIDLLTQKATQYGNLKQSLINETVTRGLDKSVPMKDSAIEWIGEVPEHWEIYRIKDYTYVKGRIGWQGLRNSDFSDQGEFYCVTGTDLKNGFIDWSNCYFVAEERYDQDKYIQLKTQDLLITKDGTIGKIALVDKLPMKATLNSGLFVSRPLRTKYSNEFMYWILNSSSFRNYIDLTKGGSTIQHLYQNVFDRFLYACPPLCEQKAIADYLDTKTAQIDQITQTINTQIEKLKELRKTLINDVVTGKIRVTEDDPSSHHS